MNLDCLVAITYSIPRNKGSKEARSIHTRWMDWRMSETGDAGILLKTAEEVPSDHQLNVMLRPFSQEPFVMLDRLLQIHTITIFISTSSGMHDFVGLTPRKPHENSAFEGLWMLNMKQHLLVP